MKALVNPADEDGTLLDRLEQIPALSYLAPHKEALKASYFDYRCAFSRFDERPRGCPLPASVQNRMRNHYKDPPTELSYISRLRKELSPLVCPMCGSFHTFSLDHILPRESFPEFSLFSWNLVPACSCNIKRGTTTFGPASDERVLHPYFDALMQQRLIRACFSGDLQEPAVAIEPLSGLPPAVGFHVRYVVKKMEISEWMLSSLGRFRQVPTSVLGRGAEVAPVSVLKQSILNAANDQAEYFGTPNNWTSVFLFGLAEYEPLLSQLTRSFTASSGS